jgi:prevent-host-death family protein
VTVTATEAKAKLLGLLDQVEAGQDIEITRHGKPVARITRARKGPLSLKDRHKGLVWSDVPDEELFSTGERWNAQD